MLSKFLLWLSKCLITAIGLVLIWSAIDSFNHFAARASSNDLVIPPRPSEVLREGGTLNFQNPSPITPLTNLMSNPKATITFNNFTITADVANTFWSRTRGLSDRSSLHESEGMLFTYSKPQMTYFWMKDMNFPIDIVWLKKISDTEARVVGVESNLPPLKKFAFVYYYPPAPVDLVLEISAGLSNTIGLTSGQVVEFGLSS